MVNDVFELDGEVPKTKLRGETANITHISEFGWYNWVYYKENAVTYPYDKSLLGQWLGPSMDIGPTLCAKILKSNGQRVHRSSYHHLTEDEINSPGEKEKHQLFDKVVEQRLGEAVQSPDFGEGYETPTFEPYANDDGNGIGHAEDADDEPMPLTFDNYLGAEVVLPKGDDMMAGKVVRRKRNSDGEAIGQENRTPCWTLTFMRLSLLMAAVPSLAQMPSQRTCMHSAMWKGTSSH